MNQVHIIGLGLGKEDLTSRHLKIIEDADVLVGGRRQLDLFPAHKGKRLVIKHRLEELIREIQEHMAHKKVVVLASGDPLFYGIGSFLTRHLPQDQVRIHPNLSSVSAAFAAIREPWHDARVVSLHGKCQNDFSFSALDKETKVVFLTDPHNDPFFIARQLIQSRIHGFRFCVLERLGRGTQEKITWFDNYQEIGKQAFSHPNLVILLKPCSLRNPHGGSDKENVSHETYLGMDDDRFFHSKGLITKSEIRCISLSKLQLTRKNHVLWDIGAGSGSVSIEASRLIPWGRVYAFEKNLDRVGHMEQNREKFDCPNIRILNHPFPSGVQDLDRPDRIFIGGGGQDLEKIIALACQYLLPGGVIVVNTVLIQTMNAALRVLTDQRFQPAMVHVQISRSIPMPFGDRLEALNPVWILWGHKPTNKEEKAYGND